MKRLGGTNCDSLHQERKKRRQAERETKRGEGARRSKVGRERKKRRIKDTLRTTTQMRGGRQRWGRRERNGRDEWSESEVSGGNDGEGKSKKKMVEKDRSEQMLVEGLKGKME